MAVRWSVLQPGDMGDSLFSSSLGGGGAGGRRGQPGPRWPRGCQALLAARAALLGSAPFPFALRWSSSLAWGLPWAGLRPANRSGGPRRAFSTRLHSSPFLAGED